MDRLDAIQVFVRVIEKGSFSAVAKERGIGQPAVSKQIFALEDELGTELVHRTSRSIALTEAARSTSSRVGQHKGLCLGTDLRYGWVSSG